MIRIAISSSIVALLLPLVAGITPSAATPIEPEPRFLVTGTERLAWDQFVPVGQDLGTLVFLAYVDGSRFALAGVSCGRSSADGFTCSAPMPPMNAGGHGLELATFDKSTRLESGRSAPLQVVVATGLQASSRPSTSGGELSIVTTDGLRLRLSPVVSGLADPVDLAFTPDGRLLVAERAGRVRVIRDGRLLSAPAWTLPTRDSDDKQLLALAVGPDFEQVRFVYAIYTTTGARGQPAFCLVRLREVADTLGDRIVLLDDIPASPAGPSASLRFGPDGKLFAAFDDGGSGRLADDRSSWNGKILRLNPDGTTPHDQAANIPFYSSTYPSPRGLGWHDSTGLLWAASRQGDSGRLSVIASESARRRGIVRAAFTLPAGTVPSAMAVYPDSGIAALRGNVLIASDEGRHLLRVRVDSRQPSHILGTERLLQGQIGGVQSVTVGPDGAIYVGASRTIWRLSPV